MARWRSLLPLAGCVALPLLDLAWNLTHLNIGLSDFYGLALAARALALHGAWPQTPYFPVLYPLLLVPFGLGGSALVGGYVLSAGGLMLALFAVRRLALTLCPAAAGDCAAALVVPLAWLLPVWRVAAGSPSVDALYTGLGLWFITAAVTAWKATSVLVAATSRPPGDPSPGRDPASYSAPPRKAFKGLPTVIVLWLSAFLLPLLRYHAVVLVLPIALLLFLRVRGRWAAAAVLKSAVAALAFNYLGFVIANGQPLPAVAELQIRTGIELEQRLHFASPQELWDNYADLCDRTRSVPLLADYSVNQLGRHVAANLGMFLRQPAVVLALILVVVVAVAHQLSRRRPGVPQFRLQPGEALLALWLVLYCLALSLAYYTARAALLPALAGLALGLALAVRSPLRWKVPACLGVLLTGYLAASGFARADLASRTYYARASRELDRARAADGVEIDATLAGDTRLVPLRGNAWCLPYIAAHGSWLDDPATPALLVGGWQHLDPATPLAGAGWLKLAALSERDPETELQARLDSSGNWELGPTVPQVRIYRRR
jgi:hypothetical protein